MSCCKQNKTFSLHLHYDKKELHLTHFFNIGPEQGQIILAKEEMRRMLEDAKHLILEHHRPVEVLEDDEYPGNSSPKIF